MTSAVAGTGFARKVPVPQLLPGQPTTLLVVGGFEPKVNGGFSSMAPFPPPLGISPITVPAALLLDSSTTLTRKPSFWRIVRAVLSESPITGGTALF